ncbi:MAG: hypothetical protein LBU23_12150, partial [Planctomycetota bacterium]|nr:hypothetical protein [Planctomycetota bacterium]
SIPLRVSLRRRGGLLVSSQPLSISPQTEIDLRLFSHSRHACHLIYSYIIGIIVYKKKKSSYFSG